MTTSARSRPFPGRSIVVGIDEGSLSDHGICMGLELGHRFDVPVHLIHAAPEIPDLWPGLDPAQSEAKTVEILDGARKAVTERVRAVVGRTYGRDGKGPPARGSKATAAAPQLDDQVSVVQGHPAKVLLEEANARAAGLIVIGPHKKKELLDFSNTMRAVFARTTVPVWTQPGSAGPIRRIVAGIDLSQESMAALASACTLAKTFGARIQAVHSFDARKLAAAAAPDPLGYSPPFAVDEVRKTEEEAFDRAMEGFDWKGVDHETDFVDGDPVESLLERSEEADVVVLGTHGRTGLAAVVLGGVAYAVIKKSQKPTLAVPHSERKFKI